MNARRERGLPLPESPRISSTEKFRPLGIAIDTPISAKSKLEIPIEDRKKVEHIRLGIEHEPIPEQKLEAITEVMRESFELMNRINVMREEAKDGMYRSTWDVVEAFEIGSMHSKGRSGFEPETHKARTARNAFAEWMERVHSAEEKGGKEAVIGVVAKKFFIETEYEQGKNSLLEGFEKKDKTMNCDAKFKGVAASLEAAGFDPAKEIYLQEFADHYRTLVMTKDGLMMIDGAKPELHIPEPGTAVMPLNDYKRLLIGLEPEHRVVHGSTKTLVWKHAVKKVGWFGRRAKKDTRPVGSPRDKDAGSLAVAGRDDSFTANESMLSQLLTDLNTRLEKIGQGVLARANEIASWRSTKLALGGSIAMAMYSACGPVVEKYSSAKSPDEAADLVHDDLAELKAAFEEKVDQVARAVENAFERHDEVEKVKEKKPEQKVDGTARGKSWGEMAEQMPITNIKMTKEEFYFLLAEQDLSYGVVDFAIEHGGEDITQVIKIDVGDARVLNPSFWKAMIRNGAKHVKADSDEGFTIRLDIYGAELIGGYSRNALEQAWDDLELEYDRASGERHTPDWALVKFDVKMFGRSFLSPSDDGAFTFDRVRDEDVLDWRYALGRMTDEYLVAKARHIAEEMGDPDVDFSITNDRWRLENRASFLRGIIDDNQKMPIGFVQIQAPGIERAVFSEDDKQKELDLNAGTSFRPLTSFEKEALSSYYAATSAIAPPEPDRQDR